VDDHQFLYNTKLKKKTPEFGKFSLEVTKYNFEGIYEIWSCSAY
jgi:hypothetical protein